MKLTRVEELLTYLSTYRSASLVEIARDMGIYISNLRAVAEKAEKEEEGIILKRDHNGVSTHITITSEALHRLYHKYNVVCW